MTHPIVCRCGGWRTGGTSGFTNLALDGRQWWVHPTCGKPTEAWLRAQGDDMLNLFRGGPIDGYAYETSVLLSVDGIKIPLSEYEWTPEVVISSATGQEARVWRYIHQPEVSAIEPQENQENNVSEPESSTAAEPTVTGVKQTLSAEDGEAFLARRKAVKVGVAEFAERAGLVGSQVARLEKSLPIKPGTLEVYVRTLEAYELEAGYNGVGTDDDPSAAVTSETAPNPQ